MRFLPGDSVDLLADEINELLRAAIGIDDPPDKIVVHHVIDALPSALADPVTMLQGRFILPRHLTGVKRNAFSAVQHVKRGGDDGVKKSVNETASKCHESCQYESDHTCTHALIGQRASFDAFDGSKNQQCWPASNASGKSRDAVNTTQRYEGLRVTRLQTQHDAVNATQKYEGLRVTRLQTQHDAFRHDAEV